MSDLQKLIERVERGEAVKWADFVLHVGIKNARLAGSAQSGSLDAAKAMHEALLPGWWYSLDWVMASVTNGPDDDDGPWFNAAIEGNPARAWLLAILRAHAAQQVTS